MLSVFLLSTVCSVCYSLSDVCILSVYLLYVSLPYVFLLSVLPLCCIFVFCMVSAVCLQFFGCLYVVYLLSDCLLYVSVRSFYCFSICCMPVWLLNIAVCCISAICCLSLSVVCLLPACLPDVCMLSVVYCSSILSTVCLSPFCVPYLCAVQLSAVSMPALPTVCLLSICLLSACLLPVYTLSDCLLSARCLCVSVYYLRSVCLQSTVCLSEVYLHSVVCLSVFPAGCLFPASLKNSCFLSFCYLLLVCLTVTTYWKYITPSIQQTVHLTYFRIFLDVPVK